MTIQLSRLGYLILATFTTVPSIATVFFLLRLYVQFKLIKRLRTWENLAAGIGWLLFMGFSGILIMSAFHGVGHHFYEIPFTEFKILLIMGWVSQPVYILSNIAVKQSITLMLLRYAVDQHRKMVLVVTCIMQICAAITLFINVLQCMPASYFWTRLQGTKGTCLNLNVLVAVGYIYSAVTILYDVTMAVLPWFMVRKLQLDLRTRLMVAIILALGSVASVATIVRLPFLIKVNHASDYVYNGAYIAVLSCFETGLSITASSAATLRPLFRKMPQSNSSTQALAPVFKQSSSDDSHLKSGVNEYDIEFSMAFYDTRSKNADSGRHASADNNARLIFEPTYEIK